MSFLSPTPEQSAILTAAQSERASLMITAYAGCGKSTTLELIAKALPKVQGLALAFNVKTKKELEDRFPSNFAIKTLNGLGHQAFGRTIGKRLEVSTTKLGKIVTEICKAQNFPKEAWDQIRRLTTAAMINGLIPSTFPQVGLIPDDEETWRQLADDLWLEVSDEILYHSREALKTSIDQSFRGLVSFDDQIYMSALFGGQFPRFDLVMVDEAQDLSPLNHRQVKFCSADRLIVVGDPKQAIYAFRGADSDSMNKLRGLRKTWIDLPLATTFRCPQLIVSRQQFHAEGYVAFETNQPGRVHSTSAERRSSEQPFGYHDRPTAKGHKWSWDQITALSTSPKIAVLCRNNAPLLSMAFKLIRRGIGCQMLGRDIGKGLIALIKKISTNEDLPIEEFSGKLTQWTQAQLFAARANDDERKIDKITDQTECLLAVMDNGPEIKLQRDLALAIVDLFNREAENIVLATGHKAKGLEWSTVIHLDPWRVPSAQARAALAKGDHTPLEQDLNLKYVIETRTKDLLILANVQDFCSPDELTGASDEVE